MTEKWKCTIQDWRGHMFGRSEPDSKVSIHDTREEAEREGRIAKAIAENSADVLVSVEMVKPKRQRTKAKVSPWLDGLPEMRKRFKGD